MTLARTVLSITMPVVLLTLLSLGLLASYAMTSHAVSPASITQLSEGMHMQEVECIAGGAAVVNASADREEQWMYRGLTWCIVTFDFSANGVLKHITHDH